MFLQNVYIVPINLCLIHPIYRLIDIHNIIFIILKEIAQKSYVNTFELA